MPPSEIRKEAREALKGKWGKAACIILVYLAFTFVIGLVQGIFKEGSAVYNVLAIAFAVISTPLSFGLLISFMKLKRDEEVSYLDFFKDGFSRFGKSWGIWFHTFLRLLLPFICLIVVIILMGVLILCNTNANLSIGLIILSVVLFIATIVYMVSRYYLYAIAYNISYDNPELSSKECVLKSESLMKGNRGNLFLLELSFIGWSILACLTLGIGMLWLTPYMQVATVCFYERVAKPDVRKIDEEVKIEE